MKHVVLLGSTGSIGKQTLDVVRAHPDKLKVVALAAATSLDLLEAQVREFHPRFISCMASAAECARRFPGVGVRSMEEMAALDDANVVVVATTGRAGLMPTLRALERGKAVALANKEVIVMAGEQVMALAKRTGAPILPVDSEPSAIWQCLRGEERTVRRVIITASGGAFRAWPLTALEKVTPEQALKHPTWVMGKKITIDSSSLVNKAFEVIEVHHLFNVPWDQIEVVLHPQSIVHSMVEFADGSVKAQLGPPDMRLPIQYALLYPERTENAELPRLDLTKSLGLGFEPLDRGRYPGFGIVLDAAKRGGTFPAALCGADEVAVEGFLEKRISFLEIPLVIERVVAGHTSVPEPSLEDVLAAEAWARGRASELVGRS